MPLNIQPSWMNEATTAPAGPPAPDAANTLFNHLADDAAVTQPAARTAATPQTAPGNAQPAAQPTLTDKIARAIAIYETNRGGNAPIARESSLDTTAGVKASVRSVSQATVPWIIDALERFPQLRQNASQAVTPQEIAAARQRMTATDGLLRSVDNAGRLNAEQFSRANAAQLQAAGMTQADVQRMMEGRDLRARIQAANARVQRLPRAQREAAIRRESAAIPENQRAGIGAGSLNSYIRNPANWGENRAAWERLSLERMQGGVGNRVLETATHNDGLSMMSAVMGSQVAAQQRRTPGNTAAIVRGVAAQHNRDAAYPAGVLETYNRLYPAQRGATPARRTPPR